MALVRACLFLPVSYVGVWIMVNPGAAIGAMNRAMIAIHQMDGLDTQPPEPAENTQRLRYAMRMVGLLLTLFCFFRGFDLT